MKTSVISGCFHRWEAKDAEAYILIFLTLTERFQVQSSGFIGCNVLTLRLFQYDPQISFYHPFGVKSLRALCVRNRFGMHPFWLFNREPCWWGRSPKSIVPNVEPLNIYILINPNTLYFKVWEKTIKSGYPDGWASNYWHLSIYWSINTSEKAARA